MTEATTVGVVNQTVQAAPNVGEAASTLREEGGGAQGSQSGSNRPAVVASADENVPIETVKGNPEAPLATPDAATMREMCAKVAEEDNTPGYGPHRNDMEAMAEIQRANIAAAIRALPLAAPAQDATGEEGAYPQTIGRVHLGERRSDGESLCSHSHEVPAGHPLYWPERMGEYPDDVDPLCLEHAIEQAVDDNGWCEKCTAADLAPVEERATGLVIQATGWGTQRAEKLAASILALATSRAGGEGRMREAVVAIWSGEHNAYWQRGHDGQGAGYIGEARRAGLWMRADAERMTSHCGPEKLICLHDRPGAAAAALRSDEPAA